MHELLELYGKIDSAEKNVKIDNETDNDLIDAYNEGVKAMAANIRYLINQMGLATAFPEKVGVQ